VTVKRIPVIYIKREIIPQPLWDPEGLWREMAGNSRAHVSKPPKSFPGGGRVDGGDTIYYTLQFEGYNGHEKMMLVHIYYCYASPTVRGLVGEGAGKHFEETFGKYVGPG